ncbi:MAG: hypothetical protein GXP48_02075 [Acidobacteria bacterium]|nr:hypothetical protein [Acidobacteriota bacterium]
MGKIELQEARRLAGLELNGLAITGAIAVEEIGGARVGARGTTIYDPSGEPLFYRVPLHRGRGRIGFTDVAADEALGEPLLATTYGAAWDETKIKREAMVHARRLRRNLRYTRIRFVAYSYPKVAVQFLHGSEEVLMLEWGSWAKVPPASVGDRHPMEPGNFERWSLLEEMPDRVRRANEESFRARVGAWREATAVRAFRGLDTLRVRPDLVRIRPEMIRLFGSRELHFSGDAGTHHPCYELTGQATSVWCVAASTQMLLAFWRYGYTQDRIAQALGLGTRAHPSGLPYSRVGDVVTQIEALTSHALDATMVVNPGFNVFRDEIDENRPLISFIPGHSRTVAGYYYTILHLPGQLAFRGLLVYDPWPPNTGTIHRYENFNVQTYQYAYHAHLTLV